jgi:hypothetical protein
MLTVIQWFACMFTVVSLLGLIGADRNSKPIFALFTIGYVIIWALTYSL